MNGPDDTLWRDVRRPEAWAGELRVNLIRLLAIVVFYARHMIEFYSAAPDAPVRGEYHGRVTLIVLMWTMTAIVVHLILSRRHLPRALPYAAVLLDILMATLLCCVAGGPRTPLVVLYFAILASAPLRLSGPIVWTATLASVAGYLFVVGYYAWHVIGFDRYYATPEVRIPRGEQAVIVLALLVTGLFAGQSVRQARRLIELSQVIGRTGRAGREG